jgi:hypothetical protein
MRQFTRFLPENKGLLSEYGKSDGFSEKITQIRCFPEKVHF